MNNPGTTQREERECCLRDHRVPCWVPMLCSTPRKIPFHRERQDSSCLSREMGVWERDTEQSPAPQHTKANAWCHSSALAEPLEKESPGGLSSFCSIPRLHREPHDSYLQVLSTALGPQKALPAHSWALLDQCNLVELNSSSQHAASLGLTTSSKRPEHGLWVSKYQRTGSAPRTRV